MIMISEEMNGMQVAQIVNMSSLIIKMLIDTFLEHSDGEQLLKGLSFGKDKHTNGKKLSIVSPY